MPFSNLSDFSKIKDSSTIFEDVLLKIIFVCIFTCSIITISNFKRNVYYQGGLVGSAIFSKCFVFWAQPCAGRSPCVDYENIKIVGVGRYLSFTHCICFSLNYLVYVT